MLEKVNSNYPIEQLIDFCKISEKDEKPAARNMTAEDWENNPSSLLYTIYKEKRFDGEYSGYLIQRIDNNIVFGMGYYPCDIDPTMIITGSRVYADPNFLSSTKNYWSLANMYGTMQHDISDFAFEEGFRGEYVSFNEYNLELCEFIYQINLPDNYKRYYKDENNKHWRKPGFRITPYKKIGPVTIKYTKQWVLYHIYEDHWYENTFVKNLEEHMYD